jgi:regulator of PEP synthase PpsR (kinase-PPPase family)
MPLCRCGKTPLSIYLGQRGYKVANLPLVPEAPLPKQLFEIDQQKIVALLIDPVILAKIRAVRVAKLGVSDSLDFEYAAAPVLSCPPLPMP